MPYPVVPRAGGGRQLARRKKTSAYDTREDLAQDVMMQGFERGGARTADADATRGETLGMIRGFDPRTYAHETAGALHADYADARMRTEHRMGEGRNARGFYNSNVGATRNDRYLGQQLARSLAGLGMQAAGMHGQNIDRMAGVSARDMGREQSEYDRSTGFLSSERGRDLERELGHRRLDLLEDEQGGGGFWGALGGIAGTLAGSVAGGAGSGIGGAIGKRVGGWLGGGGGGGGSRRPRRAGHY